MRLGPAVQAPPPPATAPRSRRLHLQPRRSSSPTSRSSSWPVHAQVEALPQAVAGLGSCQVHLLNLTASASASSGKSSSWRRPDEAPAPHHGDVQMRLQLLPLGLQLLMPPSSRPRRRRSGSASAPPSRLSTKQIERRRTEI
uniref:Uncharacterized protein n=1 Tax=Aegilops tauschii subsp. strangulata TaxID=200361 RepID=A0A453GGJ3_AEGTS